jgi:hypothetical protein
MFPLKVISYLMTRNFFSYINPFLRNYKHLFYRVKLIFEQYEL